MRKEEERFAESTLFEGIVSLRALIAAMENVISDRKIDRVFYAEERLSQNEKEYKWLCHQAEKYGFEIEVCKKELISGMTVGNTHGGIAAHCTERTIPELSSDIEGKFFVMIDGVEDPYNFGYAIRTLYAAGVDAVILTPRSWMSAAGVVCRASAGASEQLRMYIASPTDAVDILRQKGCKIVCAELEDSVSVYDADLTFPLLLIVGGEKRGISGAVLAKADLRVRIDYARKFDASLSTASAASVISYEIFRQNR